MEKEMKKESNIIFIMIKYIQNSKEIIQMIKDVEKEENLII